MPETALDRPKMATAYIIDAVRTPVGRRGGALAAAHPADLGAHVLGALIARTAIDPNDVDDVVLGCVDTVGPQAGDIARTAWLAAGLPESVPGVTVDRQCGSSQQAAHFAAQAVLSGTAGLVVAGGVQNMSLIPIAKISRVMRLGVGRPVADRVVDMGEDVEGIEGGDQRGGFRQVAAQHLSGRLLAEAIGDLGEADPGRRGMHRGKHPVKTAVAEQRSGPVRVPVGFAKLDPGQDAQPRESAPGSGPGSRDSRPGQAAAGSARRR